ncbi:peptide ABC transporter permease [Amylibacter sp. IMCC11727]|uniref:EamA family transporter n=1 Tax=Amylibacter sp. IMCC11727 TaxID=3039851 RepID=UPI00244E146A|nr:peptide ABC transporter permease [Amylibacter sp. IMCC11727]WGI22540.1 peptide ABC transporter permease [Amylibacter sp. IMCC11727]
MTVFVFAAVLFAALLHASWNAIVKFGDDKFQGMVLLSIAHGIIGLMMIAAFPMPKVESWPLLAGSVLFHLIYKSFLTVAYMRGDLSRVYPIARGTAPMIVLAVSLVILSDVVTGTQIGGILLVGLGIILMARGVFTQGEERALIPYALLAAVGTAGYSLFDGLGARASGNASGYVGWLFFLDAFLFTLGGLFIKGRAVLPKSAKIWTLGMIAGAFSVGAYWIAVWAMTIAPIALVTALREVSVLFAVLIGVLFFKDKADAGKIVAALVIVAGVIAIRI